MSWRLLHNVQAPKLKATMAGLFSQFSTNAALSTGAICRVSPSMSTVLPPVSCRPLGSLALTFGRLCCGSPKYGSDSLKKLLEMTPASEVISSPFLGRRGFSGTALLAWKKSSKAKLAAKQLAKLEVAKPEVTEPLGSSFLGDRALLAWRKSTEAKLQAKQLAKPEVSKPPVVAGTRRRRKNPSTDPGAPSSRQGAARVLELGIDRGSASQRNGGAKQSKIGGNMSADGNGLGGGASTSATGAKRRRKRGRRGGGGGAGAAVVTVS
jgi:hypothetical protein